MKLEDNYDWLVLGNHPAALLTASLVAKLGLSVLLLPMGTTLGMSTSRSGQTLDPEPNWLVGLGEFGEFEGLIHKCLRQFQEFSGRHFQAKSESKKKDLKFYLESCTPQVLTPQARFAFKSQEFLANELEREWGPQFNKNSSFTQVIERALPIMLSYWQDLPNRLTKDVQGKPVLQEKRNHEGLRKKLIETLKAHGINTEVWTCSTQKISDIPYENWDVVARGLWEAISTHPVENQSVADLIQMLCLSRVGASFQGGMSAYRKYLLNLASQSGVHLPENTECRRIFIDRGRFSGIQVSHRGSQISFTGGILGCSLKTASEKMSLSGSSFFRKPKKPCLPLGWRFTIGLTVKREAIPEKLTSRAVWQERDAPALVIETVDSGAFQVLYLRTLMPFTEESLKSEFQLTRARRMFQKARELLPFLEKHVTKVYPEFRLDERTHLPFEAGGEIKALYGFPTLYSIPENLLIYSGDGLGNETGIEGLFVATEESYPELGNFGPTIAAIESVAWIAHRAGLPGPLI